MSGNRTLKKKYIQQFQYHSRRQDFIGRLVVDIAKFYVPALGTKRAAEFLRKRNMTEKIISRVIYQDAVSTFQDELAGLQLDTLLEYA